MEYRIVVGGKKGTFDLTKFCVGDAVITSYKKGRATSLEFTVMRDTEGKFVFLRVITLSFSRGKTLFSPVLFFQKKEILTIL